MKIKMAKVTDPKGGPPFTFLIKSLSIIQRNKAIVCHFIISHENPQVSLCTCGVHAY